MDEFGAIFKVVTTAISIISTVVLFALGHFLVRLRADNSEIKSEIAKTAEETVKNREEIHRLELKIADEYAQKEDLHDLRAELKEARKESKQNFEKMHDLQMQMMRELK